MNKLLKISTALVLFLVLCVISLSSLIYIYEKREDLYSFFQEECNEDYETCLNDEYWAKEILNGGYILHFRHAEREKWIDVQMYDSLESDVHSNGENESRYAENEYFKKAVCLNSRGLIQATAMGEHIAKIQLPIERVFSSVSCRSRQTAELAFGGYDSLHRLLVHDGPYNESYKERLQNLVSFYMNLPIPEKGNIIISAHNGVVRCEMFVNCSRRNLDLEEGGFYIIKAREEGLYLEHEFHNFHLFQKIFYPR